MATTRTPKTKEVLVIQGNYGYGHGWEDLSKYDKADRKDALADLREYRSAERSYSHRLITRRVKIAAKVANPARKTAKRKAAPKRKTARKRPVRRAKPRKRATR